MMFRLRSDLVPEHGARERFLMGTNVNTPKLQVPTPEFGHGVRARVQGLDLALGHYMVLGALEFPVSEHNTIFFSVLRHQCSRTKCEHSLRGRKTVNLIKNVKRSTIIIISKEQQKSMFITSYRIQANLFPCFIS